MRGGARYGGVWHYISLDRIAAASVTREGDMLKLSIQFPANNHVQALLSVSNAPEAEQLLNYLTQCVPGVEIQYLAEA